MGIRNQEPVLDTMTDDQIHTPVLLERCIELLAPALQAPGAVVVDATLGMGGHSAGILERFPEVTLVGIDRDPDALAIAGERLARFGDRVHLVHAVYDEIPDAVREPRHRRGRRHPVRPRGLLPAARSGRARLLLLEGRAARHADGLDQRPHRRDGAGGVQRGGTPAHLPRLRRGAARRPLREEDRRGACARAVRPLRPARRCDHQGDPGRDPASGPPGQARLPGAAHRGQPGARRPGARHTGGHRHARRRAAGSSSSPTSRSKTGSSSASSRRGPPRARPPGCPSSCRSTGPN